MPLVTSEEEMASPENGSDTIEGQGGAGFPAKRFITGTAGAIAERKKEETTLTTTIRIMEFDCNLENLDVHKELLLQMLEN